MEGAILGGKLAAEVIVDKAMGTAAKSEKKIVQRCVVRQCECVPVLCSPLLRKMEMGTRGKCAHTHAHLHAHVYLCLVTCARRRCARHTHTNTRSYIHVFTHQHMSAHAVAGGKVLQEGVACVVVYCIARVGGGQCTIMCALLFSIAPICLNCTALHV